MTEEAVIRAMEDEALLPKEDVDKIFEGLKSVFTSSQ